MCYMFVTVVPGNMKEVYKELGKRREIDFLLPVAGRYDMIARLNIEFGNGMYELSKSVAQMPNIESVNIIPSFRTIVTDEKLEENDVCGCMMIRTNKSIDDIIEKIAEIDSVAEVSAVAGDWNVMACLCGDELDDLDLAALEIRKIEGITATESYIAFPQSFTEDVIGPVVRD